MYAFAVAIRPPTIKILSKFLSVPICGCSKNMQFQLHLVDRTYLFELPEELVNVLA
jgi:hypothetical protein